MRAVILAGVGVLSIGWLALSGLATRKVDLERAVEGLESEHANVGKKSRSHPTRSRLVTLNEMAEGVRHSDDFFAALEKLEGLDRDGLRSLAEEVLVLAPEHEGRSPKDEAKYLARDAILAAVAETDPLWLLEQKEGNKGGFELAAFQNLLEDSPEEALGYYENLGEDRYSYSGGKGGVNNRLFQLVFAHLASRDPEAGVEHLFAMDVSIRNLPPPELLVLQLKAQAKALWDSLKRPSKDGAFVPARWVDVHVSRSDSRA